MRSRAHGLPSPEDYPLVGEQSFGVNHSNGYLIREDNPSSKETVEEIKLNWGGWVGLIISLGIFVLLILVEVNSFLRLREMAVLCHST